MDSMLAPVFTCVCVCVCVCLCVEGKKTLRRLWWSCTTKVVGV
jgi:hypothetical protein